MKNELKGELKNISLTQLVGIYDAVVATKKSVVGNKVEVSEKDLKPKRKKRGSKN